jgi:sulfur-oxidizing protein SoxY
VGSAALGLATVPRAQAQGMVSGKLLSLRDMLDPIVAGARVVRSGVNIETLVLADNGLSVPFRVWVDSPMTAQDHVTDLWLLSQRNPVTVMAKMRMGPHLGRAEFSTRVRLAGGQQLVALARLSSGEFRYQVADLIVTEAGCVDGS